MVGLLIFWGICLLSSSRHTAKLCKTAAVTNHSNTPQTFPSKYFSTCQSYFVFPLIHHYITTAVATALLHNHTSSHYVMPRSWSIYLLDSQYISNKNIWTVTDILSQVFTLCMPRVNDNLLHIILDKVSHLYTTWPEFTDEGYPV